MAENIEARFEPIDGELLWLQGQHRHRSYSLFHGEGSDTALKARRADKKLWDHIKALPNQQINHNVFHYISEAGFAGILRTGFHRLDHGLVTALVERWRPETHTFHFPIGEATITLQDVQVLWGLPIDGPAVTGHWNSFNTVQWIALCVEWLGFQPLPTQISGGKIKLSALIRELNEDLVDNQVAYQQRARIYLLALIGGHLFVDSGQNEVSLNFLQNLQDLSREGRKSWGSAVLAFLYRNMCNTAEKSDLKGIQGALVLLQYWAWTRMPHITPKIVNGAAYNYQDCYAARWNFDMSYLDTPRNVLVTYRSAFTALRNDQFLWTPYDAILHSLPQDCTDGSEIWRYSGWLIFWSTVEPILAHRVARQFGFTQDIPHNGLLMSPQLHREIHDTTRIGRSNINWGDIHAQYIAFWNQRRQLIYQGHGGVMATREYMQWYYRHTVLFITDPGRAGPAHRYPDFGATQQFYEEGVREMYNRAEQRIQRQPETRPILQDFVYIPQQMMDYGHNVDRMNYGSQNFQFSQPAYHPPNNPDSFYARPHPAFSTNPATPSNFFAGASSSQQFNFFAGASSSQQFNLFNTPTNVFAPDYGAPSSHQQLDMGRRGFSAFTPVPMQNLSSQNPSSSRYRDVNLDDDDDDDDDGDDDDEPQQPLEVPQNRRNRRRPRCGTGGHR